MEPVAGGEWGVSSGRYVLSAPADGGEERAEREPGGGRPGRDRRLHADCARVDHGDRLAVQRLLGHLRVPRSGELLVRELQRGQRPEHQRHLPGRAAASARSWPTSPRRSSPAPCTRCGSSGRGAALRVFRAGEQVAAVTDAASTDGRVGFGSRNDGGTFDDLVVTGPAPRAASGGAEGVLRAAVGAARRRCSRTDPDELGGST